MATSPVPGLQVTRYQGDLSNPDVATAQTIAVMCDQIHRAAQDKLVRAAVTDAVRRVRGGPLYVASGIDPWKHSQAICESAWWWVKHALRFVHHNGLIQVWFNERDQLQLLISPDLLLRMDDAKGDCAIYSMLLCAMLESVGLGWELATAAVTPNEPEYDHVWCRAVLPDGRRLSLDASHGKYPGWQVPFEHRNRTQIWDQSGTAIPDAAPRRVGLHAYQARPIAPILPKRLALVPGVGFSGYKRRRGLGQDTTSTDYLDQTLPLTSDIPAVSPTALYNPASYGSPSTMNPFTSALANATPGLLSQWTQIGSNMLAPTTQIQGPGGTVITTPSSNAPAVLGPFGAMGVTGGGGAALLASQQFSSFMPIILIGGLAVVLIMVMGRH